MHKMKGTVILHAIHKINGLNQEYLSCFGSSCIPISCHCTLALLNIIAHKLLMRMISIFRIRVQDELASATQTITEKSQLNSVLQQQLKCVQCIM